MKEKTCKKCNKKKRISSFYRDESKKGGFRNSCIECIRTYNLNRYKNVEHRKKVKKYQDSYRKSEAHKKSILKHRLRKRYGITLHEYEKMLSDRDGRCDICGSQEALCIDHCHSSDVIRGMLCRSCNFGIGKFRDNPSLLRKAALYLCK